MEAAATPIGAPCRNRVLVIYNPTAGFFSARRFDRVLRRLTALGAKISVRRTVDAGDAERIVADTELERFDVVVAAGGDGTVNEVVNGLADAQVPLAVLPLGTANVLALEIAMPDSADAIARTIVSGPVVPVSLGVANGRRFIMMAGVGFDAHLVARIDPRAKRIFGRLVYLVELLVGMFRFRRHRYRVRIDGHTYDAASVVIANGRHYGGTFTCATAADIRDPTLDVCLFLHSGPWNVIRYAVALALGRLNRLADFRIVRGREVVVEGSRGEPVQCDGDIAAALPLHASPSVDRLMLVFGG
jgi:YegS/Rv2252/BmrU family lipid kinase